MLLKKNEKRTAETTSPLGLLESLLARMFFLLKKATLKAQEFSEENLAPLGLTGRHLGVMLVIEEKGSISQQEIGKCIQMDRTTMVQVIDELEKMNLVERKESPTDRRAYAVYLTAKGKAILPKADQLGWAAEKRFLAHLDAKEQKELARLLKKLVVAHYSESRAKE
ncbi:MAG TPA: MarR family transcriptional regulator [bacterium]|jgi:DNA-binding MarR family transcriptional regulator|nr:MarR family transcriptional regulator [bacterium]